MRVDKLVKAGFDVDVVGDSTIVARQVPQPGVVLLAGSRVTLYSTVMTVESGERIRVPKLTGKSVREAIQHLNQGPASMSLSVVPVWCASRIRLRARLSHTVLPAC